MAAFPDRSVVLLLNCLRDVLSIIAAKLDFFLHMVHRRFFVAEIQRRIVLKFQIFRIISFEDIIVQSWSGPNLNFAQSAGHNGPVELKLLYLAEF